MIDFSSVHAVTRLAGTNCRKTPIFGARGSRKRYVMGLKATQWRMVLAAGCVIGLGVGVSSSGAQSVEVQAAFERGARAMQSGQAGVAEQAFRDAVRLAPQMAEAHLDLGLVLGREGKIDEAIRSLRQALVLDPNANSAYMFLGIFLYQNNQADEAQKELQKELVVHPNNAEALTWLGTVELAQGAADKAVRSFDRAYSLLPNDLNVLELRGRAHSMVAKDSYARMARLAPGSWHVHRVQAELYADEGRHADAVAEYQAAIQLQPNNPDLYEGLGDEYRSMSQLDAAQTAYRKGLELGPANPVAMYNLGSALVESGDAASGVPLLEAMLSVYPGSPVAEYYLGRGLSNLGKDQEAIPWLEKSAAGGGTGEIARRSYYELTRAYHKLHQTDAEKTALAAYNRLRVADEKKGSEQVQDWKKLGGDAAALGSSAVPHE